MIAVQMGIYAELFCDTANRAMHTEIAFFEHPKLYEWGFTYRFDGYIMGAVAFDKELRLWVDWVDIAAPEDGSMPPVSERTGTTGKTVEELAEKIGKMAAGEF